MDLVIEPADFGDARLTAFLRAHLDDLAPTAPTESQHALSLAELDNPSIRVWVVRHRSSIAATGALAKVSPSHEELKSMRTDPELRGRGIARSLLEHMVADARSRGIARVSLETGSMEFFAPARRLYTWFGFVPCPPFGDYRPDPNSVFMTMPLD